MLNLLIVYFVKWKIHSEFKTIRASRIGERETGEIKHKTFSEIRNSYDSSSFFYDIQENTIKKKNWNKRSELIEFI